MILAIDQGTTGTTCLVVDEGLRVVGRGYVEVARTFPEPGWVQQDPSAIWSSVEAAAAAALADAHVSAARLDAIGITNQRETTIGRERAENPFLRVWLGAEPEGTERVTVGGRDATLVVWSPDYDGKGKAWVRFDDGTDAIVGGSRVERG